ncbi:MAG TPA: DUF72 domain-containing protein [Caulobacteraceae bacterium]
MTRAPTRVGTAGWSIPRAAAAAFPSEGSGLERYAAVFNAVEIDSTFYRSHRAQTFERWRAATPSAFRFAVKAPRAITHEARLIGCEALLAGFFDETAPLAEKLGPILIQLPPSLRFEPRMARSFFAGLRKVWPRAVVFEPRHLSWFGQEATQLLSAFQISCVAADPPIGGNGAPAPGASIAYWRLHGSPRVYYSDYGPEALAALREEIDAHPAPERWCIFDNTASGAATANALTLMDEIDRTTGTAA